MALGGQHVILFLVIIAVLSIGLSTNSFSQETKTVNVSELKRITLLGEGFDADEEVLTFLWEQTSGEPVKLSANDVPEPQFIAPAVENGKTKELIFRLMVTDPSGASDMDSVRIIVNPVNQPPTADAGRDQVIYPTVSAITLMGSATDPDGDRLRYEWKQIAGEPISLSSTSGKHLTIPASMVDFENVVEPLTFEFTVRDGYGGVASDVVDVFPVTGIGRTNPLLDIDAGPIQIVDEGTLVTLQGSGKSVDDRPISFTWEQNIGPKVTLSDRFVAQPQFTAPEVENNKSLILSFLLTGYASGSGSATDLAIVKVVPVNHPPNADAGMDRTVRENTMVELSGTGSDPDGDNVFFKWNQTSGQNVLLNFESPTDVTFTAPDLPTDTTETLTFELTVTDTQGDIAIDSVNIEVSALNRPPNAFAGPDKQVIENSNVVLSGSGFDPDGDDLELGWSQISGNLVGVESDQNPASFTAPDLLPGEEMNLVFEFSATDPFGKVGTDRLTVKVVAENHPPRVDAGPDKTVNEDETVRLFCMGSDPDGDRVSFSWRQIGGMTMIELTQPNQSALYFTSPSVVQDSNFAFECSVSDGEVSRSDSVNVRVLNTLTLPIVADAGRDRIVNEEIMLSLDGSGSHDPENQELFYSWTQLSGESVELSSTSSISPSFTTPTVANEEIKVLTFELRVFDENGRSDVDTVKITVDPVNAEPVATADAREE